MSVPWPVAALILAVLFGAAYLAALLAVAALMVAWRKLRRPRRAERLLAASLREVMEAERLTDMGYMTGGVDPRFDPTGAPHPAFRKTGETT